MFLLMGLLWYSFLSTRFSTLDLQLIRTPFPYDVRRYFLLQHSLHILIEKYKLFVSEWSFEDLPYVVSHSLNEI